MCMCMYVRAVKGAQIGETLRVTRLISRRITEHAFLCLAKATRELPEDPYILHRKTMRAQDSSKVGEGGGQRIHVSTLIQLNVYNIIRYECMCMCVCVYMYTSIHIMYACAFVSCVKM